MNKILDKLKKGLEYQKKNSFQQAEDLYKSVLKIFPDADLIDIKTYGDKDE